MKDVYTVQQYDHTQDEVYGVAAVFKDKESAERFLDCVYGKNSKGRPDGLLLVMPLLVLGDA
jgi:hypothetical protein